MIFMLVAMVYAKPVEIPAGPYKVSFDLNTSREYNITLHPEVEDNDSSWYYLEIMFDNDSKAGIGINHYKSWQYADFPCTYWIGRYLKAEEALGEIINGSSREMIIDGKNASVVDVYAVNALKNKTINSTMAEYWLDSQEIAGYGLEAGRTNVEIISILPENLTEDLLNTLHIEAVLLNETLKTMSYSGEQSIAVRDQTADDPLGAMIIPEVISQGPAYVVVLSQAGDVLGYQSVGDGVNRDVVVTLDGTPSSQWLYATLNKGGAVRSPWWKYPFVPDADVTSNMFLDQRVTSDSRRGTSLDSNRDAWLSEEDSTSTMSPNYSRSRCMEQMKANGYPPSTAAFFCDRS